MERIWDTFAGAGVEVEPRTAGKTLYIAKPGRPGHLRPRKGGGDDGGGDDDGSDDDDGPDDDGPGDDGHGGGPPTLPPGLPTPPGLGPPALPGPPPPPGPAAPATPTTPTAPTMALTPSVTLTPATISSSSSSNPAAAAQSSGAVAASQPLSSSSTSSALTLTLSFASTLSSTLPGSTTTTQKMSTGATAVQTTATAASRTGSNTISSSTTFRTLTSSVGKMTASSIAGAGNTTLAAGVPTSITSSVPVALMSTVPASSSTGTPIAAAGAQISSIPQATLDRQTKVGIGVGVGVWAVITIVAFVFWLMRRWKRKKQQAPSGVFSEYDPQHVYFGERSSQGIGAAIVQATQMDPPPTPPRMLSMVDEERPWSFRPEDTAVERGMAPGLRSHPIATRNTMEDLGLMAAQVVPREAVTPSPQQWPIAAGDTSRNYSITPSIESLTDPDFPFRTRTNSPDEQVDYGDTQSLSRLRPGTTESAVSVNEIRPLPPSLSKLQGWLDENRRRSRPLNMQSRWSETEDTASRTSRPPTYVGNGLGNNANNASKSTV